MTHKKILRNGLMSLVGVFTFFLFSKRINSYPSDYFPLPSPAQYHSPLFGVWLAYWDEDNAITSLKLAKDRLAWVSPVWYHLSIQGTLIDLPATKQDQIIQLSESFHIPLWPTINNEGNTGFDSSRVTALLNSPEKSSQFIDALIYLATLKKYRGFDIDWENINTADRDAYSSFIEKLSGRLHENSLSLSVTIHPQTSETTQNTLNSGYDIPRLTGLVDQIRVMVYDYHYSTSYAGAITPTQELHDTITYLSTVVPLSKLVVSLPLYGYDWVGNQAESYSYTQALNLISSYSPSLYRDAGSGEITATYSAARQTHELWFQDSVTTLKRIELAQSLGVYQFYFWRLGVEDPLLWLNLQP